MIRRTSNEALHSTLDSRLVRCRSRRRRSSAGECSSTSHAELSVAALPDCTLRLAELFGTE